MLDITEIDTTIKELCEEDTTFATCYKLASLYIVKYFTEDKKASNSVISEYKDILPAYQDFVEAKSKYQVGNITYDKVIDTFKYLTQQLKEFLHILYSSADTREEHQLLINCIYTFISDINE